MGSFATILLMSSCTSDSPVDVKKVSQLITNKIPETGTGVFANGEPNKDITH